MTDTEAAERREMIRQFRDPLLKRSKQVGDRLVELTEMRRGFGSPWRDPYDDPATQARNQKEENEVNASYVANLAEQQQIDWFWSVVVQVFGRGAVDLAIEEGEKRIGTIPYAD